jgi:hypothetical protein
MTCTRTICPIWITCQKKVTPPPACLVTGFPEPKHRIIHNGYAAMAFQEQQIRMDAIEYSGEWE